MPPTTTAPPATVRRLSGFKPTGHLQLGNLVGAIRPMLRAQDGPTPTGSIVTVVDLHALTVDHRPHEVRALTLELATVLLAAGVDPERTTLYVQSHVPEHTELHYLLECVTGYGEAQRMIQFREKARGQHHVRLSLLTYPVLMAADILLTTRTRCRSATTRASIWNWRGRSRRGSTPATVTRSRSRARRTRRSAPG